MRRSWPRVLVVAAALAVVGCFDPAQSGPDPDVSGGATDLPPQGPQIPSGSGSTSGTSTSTAPSAVAIPVNSTITPPWVANKTSASDANSSFGPFRTSLALEDCAGNNCWESTLAVAADGTVVARVNSGDFAVSKDGGQSWTKHPYPPYPATSPAGFVAGENVIGISPTGRLMVASNMMQYTAQAPFTVLAMAGIHFAASDDDGATWIVNSYIGPGAVAGQMATGIDRPWIAFGPSGETYLTYAGLLGGAQYRPSPSAGPAAACDIRLGVAVQRSDDGGATWTAPVTAIKDGSYCWHLGSPPTGYSGVITASSMNGQIAVGPDGQVFISGYHRDNNVVCSANQCQGVASGAQFVVAVSNDRGQSFVVREVWDQSSYAEGGYSPSVALDDSGTVYAVGRTSDGAVLVSESSDHGATWGGPLRWNAPDMIAEYGVRAVTGPLGLDVAWYARAEGGQHRLQVGRMDPQGSAPEVIDLSPAISQGQGGNGANTDFAYIAHRPDGGLAAVWSDMALAKVFVVLEEPAS